MELCPQLIEDFKAYAVDIFNEEVYNLLKQWINHQAECEGDYEEALDYMLERLDKNICWEQ